MDIKIIKEIRERSNISLAQCKKAAIEANGDIEKALVILQEWGLIRAATLSSKNAEQGKIFTYNHSGNLLAVMVEINCQTDFSANSDKFIEFGEDVAMQVAAANPTYVCADDVPINIENAQKEIFKKQIENMERKPPEKAQTGIIIGKLKKWKSDICLLQQKSVKFPKKTIEDIRATLSAQLGENVIIKRFIRWELGS